MKTIKLLLFALLISSATYAQKSQVFTTPDIVWFGLDYSKVKCIGPEGFTEPDQIVGRYFDGWNDLMISEEAKYDFKDAYDKASRINDLEKVNERNTMPSADDLVIKESYAFEPGTLEEIVMDYQTDKYPGKIGLLYVVESLNKYESHAAIFMVFFDIPSGEILFSQKHFGKAGGFGFRNYWARSIYEVMKDSGNQFSKAAKKYK